MADAEDQILGDETQMDRFAVPLHQRGRLEMVRAPPPPTVDNPQDPRVFAGRHNPLRAGKAAIAGGDQQLGSLRRRH
jgi:hypothetical protein